MVEVESEKYDSLFKLECICLEDFYRCRHCDQK